jgi:hypothetical protein
MLTSNMRKARNASKMYRLVDLEERVPAHGMKPKRTFRSVPAKGCHEVLEVIEDNDGVGHEILLASFPTEQEADWLAEQLNAEEVIPKRAWIPRAKLTADDVAAIRKRKAKGETEIEIQRDYPNVHVSTIYGVTSGRTWRE